MILGEAATGGPAQAKPEKTFYQVADDGDGVFIIQIAGNLIQSANYDVNLDGAAKPENIFWQVAGYVWVGAGAHMKGVILAKTEADFLTGSSLNGRILTQTACNLQQATIIEKPARSLRSM